jgi:hypothetical protein
MKLYKRKDFVQLPAMTIYSKPPRDKEMVGGILEGLFCKTSGPEYEYDFVVQDLLAEHGFPNGINDGMDACLYVENLRDTFQEFETDLDCCGRDGMFDDKDEFIVWDKKDVKKLIDYLTETL